MNKKNILTSFIPFTRFRIRAIFLISTAFLFYANSIFNDYALDDGIVISENEFTKKGIEGIREILTHDSFSGNLKLNANNPKGSRYRPLSLITFAIEWQFFGRNPYFSHFINVLLYCFTGFLLFYFLSKYLPLPNKDIAFIASFLFIIHPVHSEVVANIKSRDEILCFIFCIAMLIFLFRSTEKNKFSILNLFFSFVCFFLALLSKETAITYIALAPLTLYFFTGEKTALIIKTSMILPLCGILFLFIRYKAAGFNTGEIDELLNNPFLNASVAQRLATVFLVLGMYIKLLFFPHPLCYDYTYNQIPIVDFSDIRALFSLLMIAGLIIYAVLNLKNKNILSYSFFVFIITISIASNLVIDIGALMGERFLYQPSLGFALAIAYFIIIIYEKFGRQVLLFSRMLLIVVFILAAAKVISRNNDWKSNSSLFIHDVENCPNSVRALNAAVTEYVNKSKNENDSLTKINYLNKALEYSFRAEAIYSNWAAVYHDRGLVYYYLYEPEEAEKSWNMVKKLKPNYKMSAGYAADLSNRYLLKGIKAGKEKNYELSLKCFRKSLFYNSQEKYAWFNGGLIYGEMKQFDLSIDCIRKAIELDSTQVDFWYNLGGGLFSVKDFSGAKKAWLKTLELNPEHQNAKLGLSAINN